MARDRTKPRTGAGRSPHLRAAGWRPRLVAAALAVVGSLLLLAAAPALLAPAEPSRPVLEVPRLGDEGKYLGVSGTAEPARFRWSVGGQVVDDRGRLRPADRLELFTASAEDGPGGLGRTLWWAQGTDDLLAVDEGHAESSSTLGGTWRWGASSSLRVFGPALEACLFANVHQGRALGAALHLPAACFEAGRPGTLAFHERGRQVVQGVPAVRYESVRGVELWYNPAIPYPLRILDAQGTRELVSFTPGGEARRPAVAVGPEPAWVMAPRQRHGLEDAGVMHPFPLSKAFRLAQQAPDFPDLRDFLARHPDAYAAMAFHRMERHHPTVVRSWHMVVTDGSDSLCLDVNEQAWLDPVAPLATYAYASYPWPCQPAFVLAIMRVYGNGHLPEPAHGFPPPDRVPHRLASAQSALARWERHANATSVDAGYGHAILCATSQCDDVATWILAGEATFDFGPQPRSWASLYDVRSLVLVMDGSGQASMFSTSDDVAGVTARDGGGHQPLDGSRPWAPPLPLSGTGWEAVVATTGTAALLLAVLELASAGSRWAPLALFSRLRRGRLEEHPVRRVLLQAIEADPGIHFGALRRLAEAGESTVQHHLRILQTHGLVTSRRDGGYTCYFLASPSARAVRAAGVLRSRGARQVLAAIESNPGLGLQELASRTGLRPATLRYHRRRLAERGLIVAERQGRRLRFQPAPQSKPALGQANAEPGA